MGRNYADRAMTMYYDDEGALRYEGSDELVSHMQAKRQELDDEAAAIHALDAGASGTYDSGDDIVTCPKCGARTEFVEDAEQHQQHRCLSPACGFRFTVTPTITRMVPLTDVELHLLTQALDSHAYWQLAEENQRNDGFVYADEDDENAGEIADCEALMAKLERIAAGAEGPAVDDEQRVTADIAAAREQVEELAALGRDGISMLMELLPIDTIRALAADRRESLADHTTPRND